jgi:hypothetical protein
MTWRMLRSLAAKLLYRGPLGRHTGCATCVAIVGKFAPAEAGLYITGGRHATGTIIRCISLRLDLALANAGRTASTRMAGPAAFASRQRKLLISPSSLASSNQGNLVRDFKARTQRDVAAFSGACLDVDKRWRQSCAWALVKKPMPHLSHMGVKDPECRCGLR